MSRAEWRGKVDDWTWPARRKLEAKLIAFATEYAKDHPELFETARQEFHQAQIAKRQDRIAKLRQEIKGLTAELAILENEGR